MTSVSRPRRSQVLLPAAHPLPGQRARRRRLLLIKATGAVSVLGALVAAYVML